ncbi:MAG: hypothetical protein HeimC2_41500 [Candidatus Heimdallarchaeota archaeon LC_2]|nr:MAG: hypothetical protein HeimC2_41500 [Candidatus Heimdallarchaeota archaeon LC_2]
MLLNSEHLTELAKPTIRLTEYFNWREVKLILKDYFDNLDIELYLEVNSKSDDEYYLEAFEEIVNIVFSNWEKKIEIAKNWDQGKLIEIDKIKREMEEMQYGLDIIDIEKLADQNKPDQDKNHERGIILRHWKNRIPEFCKLILGYIKDNFIRNEQFNSREFEQMTAKFGWIFNKDEKYIKNTLNSILKEMNLPLDIGSTQLSPLVAGEILIPCYKAMDSLKNIIETDSIDVNCQNGNLRIIYRELEIEIELLWILPQEIDSIEYIELVNSISSFNKISLHQNLLDSQLEDIQLDQTIRDIVKSLNVNIKDIKYEYLSLSYTEIENENRNKTNVLLNYLNNQSECSAIFQFRAIGPNYVSSTIKDPFSKMLRDLKDDSKTSDAGFPPFKVQTLKNYNLLRKLGVEVSDMKRDPTGYAALMGFDEVEGLYGEKILILDSHDTINLVKVVTEYFSKVKLLNIDFPLYLDFEFSKWISNVKTDVAKDRILEEIWPKFSSGEFYKKIERLNDEISDMKNELSSFSELFKNFLDIDTGDLFEILEILKVDKGRWFDREDILDNWVIRSKNRGEINAEATLKRIYRPRFSKIEGSLEDHNNVQMKNEEPNNNGKGGRPKKKYRYVEKEVNVSRN